MGRSRSHSTAASPSSVAGPRRRRRDRPTTRRSGRNRARLRPHQPVDADPELFIAADLSTAEGAAATVPEALQRVGGVDILVNNLGGSDAPAGGFATLSEDDWAGELNTNLLAAVRLDRGLLPGMIEAERGTIVHIGSIQRRMPLWNGTLAYAAAKAALTTYSKGLANEVAPHGVRVNVVSPGFVQTTAADALSIASQTPTASHERSPEPADELARRIPLGRPNRPDEVADSSPSSSPTGLPRSSAPTTSSTAARSRRSDPQQTALSHAHTSAGEQRVRPPFGSLRQASDPGAPPSMGDG